MKMTVSYSQELSIKCNTKTNHMELMSQFGTEQLSKHQK